MSSRTPATFHKKRGFKNGQPTYVVTGVYRLNTRTGVLLCAGTVYNVTASAPRTSNNVADTEDVSIDSTGWNRKLHTERALLRLRANPHIIRFHGHPLKISNVTAYYQFRRLERFIRKIFSLYGVKADDQQIPLMSRPKFIQMLEKEQAVIFGPMTEAEIKLENEYNAIKDSQNQSEVDDDSDSDGDEGDEGEGDDGDGDGDVNDWNWSDCCLSLYLFIIIKFIIIIYNYLRMMFVY